MDKTVFIDTSAFKALLDTNDSFHKQAIKFWQGLKKQKRVLLSNNYILDETFTLLRIKNGLSTALEFKKILSQSTSALKIYRVTIEDEKNAWQWFTRNWSKLSFTDCVSFAMLERLSVDTVFTFDYHFKRAGFKIFN